VLEDQGAPRVRPDSLVLKCGLHQHLEQPWPIVLSEHSNARLVSTSLAIVNEKKELCLESVYGASRWRSDPASRYLRLPQPVRLQGNWTSIVSNWVPTDGAPIYGHWLHDALPRLSALDLYPKDTGILVPQGLKPIHWETLALLGIKNRCRPTSETHLILEKYFFSSPTSMIDCYNPYGIQAMRKAFLNKADPDYTGPKKFFFARSGKRRSIENIDAVTSLLASEGWAIVHDMDLNFAQTISLFSQATDICGFLGSNMSNVIFCSSGCRVLHWVPDIFLDGWVDLIAEILGLDYRAIILNCGGPQERSPKIYLDEILAGLRSAGY
jgi:capsular polysaccharide biosynthesis protein